ncbi:MAG: restriction endonuclease subunit S [Hydrococcus sp. Prado102]|jgi:type I restriction enzyme S subunit|nr:restriction endonuclease subunit S [Hydrococcus sp. Prado102]
MKFERYQAYKDSGVEWLGDVPEHWSLSRVKSLTKTKSGTTPQSGLSQYYDNGTHFWVRTTDLNNTKLYFSEFKVTDLAREHYNLTSIPIRSILLAMYGGMGTIGKNAILQEEVTINQSVCAIFPNDKKFVSEYLWYYIQYFRPHWEIFADSARKDPNINQEAIKRLWVTLPPLPEQKTIAHYLDTKIAQCDRKIDLLAQKAKLYGNLKQSLINETVTRGLDKSVPMKDSGVEWIGEIPEHWEVIRNKQIFQERSSISSTGKETLLTVSHITGITPRSEKNVNMFMAETMEGYKICHQGDLIINTMWAWMGALGTSNYFGICSPSYNVYMPLNNIPYNYRYFDYLVRTPNAIVEMTRNSKGIVSSRLRLYAKEFFQIEVPFPPPSEQKAIAHYLDTKTAQIDQIIQTINTQIEKLKELRKTLINDVVTGKIKV